MNPNENKEEDMLKPEEIAPKLYSLPKSIPYKVPDTYFEDFEKKMMIRISEPQHVPSTNHISLSWVVRLKQFLLAPVPKIAFASLMIVLVFFGVTKFNRLKNSHQSLSDYQLKEKLREHNKQELHNYVRSEIGNIDENLLTEVALSSSQFSTKENDELDEIVNEIDESVLENALL